MFVVNQQKIWKKNNRFLSVQVSKSVKKTRAVSQQRVSSLYRQSILPELADIQPFDGFFYALRQLKWNPDCDNQNSYHYRSNSCVRSSKRIRQVSPRSYSQQMALQPRHIMEYLFIGMLHGKEYQDFPVSLQITPHPTKLTLLSVLHCFAWIYSQYISLDNWDHGSNLALPKKSLSSQPKKSTQPIGAYAS
jgi:hypothetical protein